MRKEDCRNTLSVTGCAGERNDLIKARGGRKSTILDRGGILTWGTTLKGTFFIGLKGYFPKQKGHFLCSKILGRTCPYFLWGPISGTECMWIYNCIRVRMKEQFFCHKLSKITFHRNFKYKVQYLTCNL